MTHLQITSQSLIQLVSHQVSQRLRILHRIQRTRAHQMAHFSFHRRVVESLGKIEGNGGVEFPGLADSASPGALSLCSGVRNSSTGGNLHRA